MEMIYRRTRRGLIKVRVADPEATACPFLTVECPKYAHKRWALARAAKKRRKLETLFRDPENGAGESNQLHI